MCETADEASAAAADLLVDPPGPHVALAGGSTPAAAYVEAAELRSDWSGVELWWGDERCVPPEDPRSNYKLARETLLDRIRRPPGAVHRILGELGPDAAAAAYERELGDTPLDLVLLGIGTDGHTASLFPHAEALNEQHRRALGVPGADVARVTLTPPTLRGAQHVVFLAVGREKAEAVARACGEADRATPASLIRGQRTTLVVDREAAANL
jgi:6-phosphogluconolactonase